MHAYLDKQNYDNDLLQYSDLSYFKPKYSETQYCSWKTVTKGHYQNFVIIVFFSRCSLAIVFLKIKHIFTKNKF